MRIFMVAIALIGLVSAVALGNLVPPTAAVDDGAAVVPNQVGNVDEVETVLAQPPLADDDQQATVHNEAGEEQVEDDGEDAEAAAALVQAQSEYLQREYFDDRYFKGYKNIQDILNEVQDQAIVVPAVTAAELRYDFRFHNDRSQCTVAFFKNRVAMCERITNFGANVFCRRATVNMASYCGRQKEPENFEQVATFMRQLGEKAEESRKLFAHDYNWNNYKLPLEQYIHQIKV